MVNLSVMRVLKIFIKKVLLHRVRTNITVFLSKKRGLKIRKRSFVPTIGTFGHNSSIKTLIRTRRAGWRQVLLSQPDLKAQRKNYQWQTGRATPMQRASPAAWRLTWRFSAPCRPVLKEAIHGEGLRRLLTKPSPLYVNFTFCLGE